MKSISRFLLLLLAFTPLIVSRSLFFPFVSGKVLFVQGIVSIIFLLLGIAMVRSSIFRKEVVERLKTLFSQKIFILTSLFLLFVGVSVLFAPDMYRAFFGDLERGEGFLGILYFFGFYILTLVLFEWKHWIRFFQLTMFSGVALFIHEMVQFFGGVERPSSYTGNAIYLAVVFLFVILSSLLVMREYRKDSGYPQALKSFWKLISTVVIFISLFGIIVTETRGVMVGMLAGVFVVALYLYIKGKYVSPHLKKIGGGILILFILGGGLFFTMRDADVWKTIPGLDRLSQITFDNATVQTRLIAIGVSLDAMNPVENGWDAFLFGWGQENYHIAYNAHYNPEYFVYEQAWFDRAHNKVLDVLVMQGLLGFLAYMGIWIVALWQIIRQKVSMISSSLLFFGVAYFIQNLFVFDSVVTYIPFFSFIALATLPLLHEKRFECSFIEKFSRYIPSWMVTGKVGVIGLFLVFSFITWTVVPFSQMKGYISFTRGEMSASELSEGVEEYFAPYTYAQNVIRTHFIGNAIDIYEGKESEKNLLLQAVEKMKEVISVEPDNPRYYVKIGEAYEELGKRGLVEYYSDAEEAFRKAIELSPQRQDVQYALALNLARQDRYDEAFEVMEYTLGLEERVASGHFVLSSLYAADAQFDKAFEEVKKGMELNPAQVKSHDGSDIVVYTLLEHYYKQRDKERALEAADWLEYIRPDRKEGLDMIREYINSGEWRDVQFVG